MMTVSLPNALRVAAVATVLATAGHAQWDPNQGQWGKSDPDHVRIMTWNVEDGLCSSNDKQEGGNGGYNNWHALARVVAAMRPDILILQECADNSGNGTGSGVDSPANLKTTLQLFLYGGPDPFNGGTVDSYVQKYAPGFDLPYIFASQDTDGWNRNVIMSRWDWNDLNGDGTKKYSDIPLVLPDQYAPGGDGGIRGFMFAEVDLPDGTYAGDVVVGNCHLKAGGSQSDLDDRLEAAQNVTYLIEHWYNGAGTGTPDPFGKILDSPAATEVLDGFTPVLWGGDWNEDEARNGRKGPARWLVRAAKGEGTALDGTDRDGTDAKYDAAAQPITGQDKTLGSNKYDYLAHQDSVASLINEFIFDGAGLSNGQMPPETLGFPAPPQAINLWAADHLPVIADFQMPSCDQLASWSNYGSGFPGTLGVPSLTATDPVLGQDLNVSLGNSAGTTLLARLFLGFAPASLPAFWGGDLLVFSAFPLLKIPVPAAGVNLVEPLPPDPTLCGLDLYLQAIQPDMGATLGWSSTAGLHLHLGL